MSSFRKSLLTFGATAALTGAFAINGTVNVEAVEWEARTVEEVENDIQNSGLEAKYTIQWGDTLGTISKALDISVDQITGMNEIANRDLIIAGNMLHLSADSDTISVEDNVTHEVETFELEEKEVTEPVEEVETSETSSEESEETPVEEAVTSEAPAVSDEEEVETPTDEEEPTEVEAPVEETTEAPEVHAESVEAPVEETTTESTSAPTQQANSGSEHEAKEWIAQRESNGSYTAYNDAGGYYGRYQLNPSLIEHGASPEKQEAAADNYVAGRYGSWSEAKAFWEANGWY